MQLSEKEAELSKIQRTIETLRSEKQALEDDAINLSDRQMQLSHANRMLANELQEQQRGFGTNEYDSSTSDLSLPSALAAAADVAQPPPPANGTVANGKAKGGIGSKGGSDWDPVAAGAGVPADVLARARARRHNVIDIREYEDVVAELAHRKLEIAFGRVRTRECWSFCCLSACTPQSLTGPQGRVMCRMRGARCVPQICPSRFCAPTRWTEQHTATGLKHGVALACRSASSSCATR